MARYNRLPSLTSGMGQVASSGGGFAVVIRPPASSKIAMPAATSLLQSVIATAILTDYLPFPTTTFPPNVERSHCDISQIKCRTSQTPDSMHHTTSSRPPTEFSCHVHKTLNLSMHIAIRNISPVFTPLAREDAACGGFLWHWRNRVPNKW